jgi:amino acid permease
MEISINTPALLFPAITLLMLAYTNRFLALASLVRKLHDEFLKQTDDQRLLKQINNLRTRISLIRYMQAFGVLSFVLCVVCMYVIVTGRQNMAHQIFASSLICLLVSLILSLIEIWKSTHALDLELSDIESQEKNFLQQLLSKSDKE